MKTERRAVRWGLAAATLASLLAGCSGSSTPKGASVEDAQSGSGDFVLVDPQVGLDSLTSYQSTLTVSFDGTAAGQPSTWSSTSVITRTSDPDAAVLTVVRTGDVEAADPDLVAEAAGLAFQRDATGTCTSNALDPATSFVEALEPAAQLAGIVGGEAIGDEDVDGIPASGYRFDERAVGQAGVATTVGEVWMAKDGGYVASYSMTTTAGPELFGEGLEGTMSWDYALSNVNGAAGVVIPPECGGALLDVPLPADASDVARFDTAIQFDTATSPADVVAFYQQQAGARGWVPEGEPSIDDERAIVEFSDGDALVTVVALAGDGGTTVIVVSGEKPAPASSGGGTTGTANVVISGGHTANVTWQYMPEYSNPNGGTLTFTDPTDPLPEGSFLTIVIGDGISYSDGSATFVGGSDVCTFTVERQDETGVAGTVTCTGVQAIGAGTVDIAITFSTGP